MPNYLIELEDGRKFQVEADTPPTQEEFNQFLSAQQVGQTIPQQPTGETPGYLSQLGTALGLGYRQMASGVGATFNALTGDTADVAAEMVEMGKLQREQQAAQTPEDVEFMRRLEEAKKAGEEAQGPIEYIGALAQYPAAALAEPGAAFKTAVQSAPNVLISAGTQLAGRALGGLVGGAGGLELGPGAILTGIAGSIAGGALSNTLMEAGPSIYDVLNERTQGAAANMTADQIATYLKDNPDIIDEGLKTGAIRGTVIGAVESLGMKGSGKLMTMPERAAARAVQKKLVDAGVDIASKEAVDKALLDPALRTATRTAAEAAKKQFSSAGNLARLAGGSAIETGAAVGGELAAQAAAGQEIDTTEAFLEGLGEMALSVPISAANKTIEGAKYMLNPALQNPDTQLSAQAAQETINQSELQLADKVNAEAARLAANKAAEAAIVPAPAPITLAPAPAPITPASVTEPQAQLPPTMEQAAAPAVGIPPTPTIPTQDATIQREIPKDGQQERIETDEGGATAETGGGNRPVVGRQVEAQEEVDLKAGLPRQQPGEAPDIITWLKENYSRKPIVFVPKAKRRKATAEAEALGILDELPLPVKRRLFSFDYGEGTNVANMDEIAGLAYEANLIPSSDPTVLAQSIIEAFKARKAGTSLIKEGEQQMETAEQRTIEFYKAASDRTAPLTLIPRRDLDIGDVVQVGDDKMRVTYEYDEDGYPTALILTGPKFGEQRFDPNKPLKAENTSNASDLKAVNNNTASQDQIDALVNRGFVEIYKGSPVITDVGVEQMPKKPKLTADQRKAQIDAEQAAPAEKAAEVDGVTAPVAEPIVAEKPTPAPLREGAGDTGVAQPEPVEGSIPTVREVSPETETLSTPQSLAQSKEDAKQQKKDSDENLKALNSLEAGTKTNPVFGTVTREDASEAMRLIEDGKELPNVFFTVVTTREEFLADPRNEKLYPQVWNALKTNKKIEGLFDDATNTPFVFTDGVVVYDLDRKAAQELGISPQVAAVRRVLRHENIHKGMLHLTPSEMVAMRRFLATIFSEEALDNLAKIYTKYANWRSDPRLYFQAIEEIVNQKLDQSTVLPKDGIWGQFFELLTEIWRRITGKRNQPTVKDMKDVMRLVRNGLIRSAKAQADQTKDGGNVMLSVRAYHGTPHKVDKFSLSKIGTGEGAQVYGWGLYFAQNKEVADAYRSTLTQRDAVRAASQIAQSALSVMAGRSQDEAAQLAQQNLQALQRKYDDFRTGRAGYTVSNEAEYLKELQADVKFAEEVWNLIRTPRSRWDESIMPKAAEGNLYTVELLPDEGDFLDWDKPLSEQSEKVKNILSPIVEELIQRQIKKLEDTPSIAALYLSKKKLRSYAEEFLAPNLASGMGLYDLVRGLEGNKRGGITPDDMSRIASEYLASIGIPGIRYFDADSRGKKEGTRNYVIFDENLVKILEENGQVLTTPTDQTRDGGNVMMSMATPATDAEYLAAVEAGDMEKAQRVVDQQRSLAVVRALQPEWGGVPKSNRVTSRFQRGDTLDEQTLQEIQINYEKWAKRAGIEPTDLVTHLSGGGGSVWTAYGTADRFVGQFIGDVFAVSHFAPSGNKAAVDSLLDLLNTQTPVVFAVPDTIADQLERVGFQRSIIRVPMRFKGVIQYKNLLINESVSENDIAKLAAWWVASSKLNGLFDQIEDTKTLEVAERGLRLLERIGIPTPSQRFQPTSPDIRFSLPIVHSSESEASYANGQMAASMVTFTPRQMDVYSALEGAYNMSRKPGRHSVPLSELYQAALEALPDMTQQEFSEAVQTMYQNNSALLNAGESDFSVVNKDGDRVSSVVFLGKGTMASMIPSSEVPEIANKLASDLKASVTEGEQTPYEGLSFTGVTPKTHARVDYRGVRKSAEDFVNQMIRAQKAKGKSYADALIEVANTITNPSFANEYMADSGTEEKLLATQAVAGPLNAKIYSALLTTKDDVTRIKLNDAYTNVSTYYEGSGTIGGTVMGYRAWESTNGKYGWMLDSWKADALKNAEDAINSQMGGSVSIQIGESLRRSVEGVSDSTANEVESQAQEDRDAALFREGQEALIGENKNIFESIKSFLKTKAIINRRKLIRAGNQAMASIVSDEEYNAIMAMSDEEANALEKEIDAKLSAALKKLNSSLSGREDVKAKVDAAINVATDRANKGEDITFTQVTIEEAMADLFKTGDDTREKIVDNVADALLKRAKQAMAKPSKISSIQQLIASIKRTLLANIKVDKTTDADSLGRMLAMTFAQQVSEARVYASSWSEGRKKVREMLAEIGIEESELDSELNKIMPPTPTLAFSPSAAKRAIALAMEESGVSRENLLDPRPEISKQAKDKLMAHLDKAAANENLTEQGWNKTGNTGRQLAEKAIDEAIAKWRIEQQNRLEISNLVAEQADNPVSIEDFAKKLSKFNLTPKQVKKYFDIAARAAVRSVEMRKDQARRIIYTRGDIRPDVLEKEVDGDTVIDAFTDQVSSPTDLKTFVERLDKLGVTFDLAESLFNTAARERRDRQRTRVFDMIEGPRALQKMLDEIRNVRAGLEVPLRSPIPWKELLSKPAKSVAEYRQKVLDAIMANPDLASVDSEVKERLADMFADVWQQQLDKVVNQIIDNYTQQLDRAKRRHAGDVLNKTRLQVIQHLNLNALSNDAFTRILGEKFGIKMELTEAERENIQRLVDIQQDETLPKNKRNQAANDLAFALVNDTKVGWSERLSAFWTSSVLAGWNTMIAIGLAFLNGANIIMVNLPMKIMSNLINGDFKGAFYSTFDSLNDIKRYIEAFPEALERSWHYLNTGRVEFLESEASAPDRIFRGWADVLRYRKVAEAMANDPKKVTQWMGKFSVMISRMMTALDGFNTILTKRGMLSMAVRLGTKNPEDHQRILEKASLEHYRQQILASDPYFAQMNSEKRALLNATAEAMMYEAMNKEGAKLENADFFASESAMTMNPTGIGGIVYNKIRSADVESQEFMRRKLAEQKLKAAAAGPMSLENAKLAGMFVAHFIAYNAINMIGLRFARFASNKFNQGLSFIPFVGILRGWEASNNQLADRKEAFYDMIKRNQMVGMFFVGAGSILLRAIADEPDDEERGFFINGGLKNVPTDKRRQLQESGKLEYRLGAKIGGKWYIWNYQNSPYSQLFAAVGAISDIIRFSPDKWNDKSKLDVALSVAASGLSSTLDLPALQGLGTLMGRSVSSSDPTEQFWENIGATTANWVGGFIPKPFMDVDYILDDNRRKYTTIWEKFAGKVPFYRRYVGEDYYNILGDPIKANTLPGSREFLVGRTEPVYQILGALNSRNIWLTPANAEYRMVGKGRNRRRLTQEEADAYSFETGKGYKAMILRYGPRALQMDPERAKAFLHDKADQIRDRALKKVYRGYRSRTATP